VLALSRSSLLAFTSPVTLLLSPLFPIYTLSRLCSRSLKSDAGTKRLRDPVTTLLCWYCCSLVPAVLFCTRYPICTSLGGRLSWPREESCNLTRQVFHSVTQWASNSITSRRDLLVGQPLVLSDCFSWGLTTFPPPAHLPHTHTASFHAPSHGHRLTRTVPCSGEPRTKILDVVSEVASAYSKPPHPQSASLVSSPSSLR